MNIGAAIKKERKNRKISQLSLGLMVGNDAAYISRMETNKQEPSIHTFVKIAQALNVDPVKMFATAMELN